MWITERPDKNGLRLTGSLKIELMESCFRQPSAEIDLHKVNSLFLGSRSCRISEACGQNQQIVI